MALDELTSAAARTLALQIATPLCGDSHEANTVADEALARVVAAPDQVGAHVTAWTAAHTVALSLDLPPAAEPVEGRREWLTEAPVAARVVLSLRHLAGMTTAQVANATGRSPAAVEEILSTYPTTASLDPVSAAATPVESITASAASDESLTHVVDGGEAAPLSAPADGLAEAATAPTADLAAANFSLTGTSSIDSLSTEALTAEMGITSLPPATPPPSTPGGVAAADAAFWKPEPRRRISPTARYLCFVALFIVAIVAASVVVLNASRSDSSASSPDAVGDRAMGTPGSVDRGSPSDGCKATNGAAPVAPLTLQSTVGTPTRAMRLAAYGDLPSDAGRPLFVDLGDIGETLDQHVAAVPLDSIAIDNAAMIVTLVGQDLPAQWNVERVAGEPDDAGFVLAVIDDLARRYCIDLQRVSVLGYGAGAHMAATIVCAAPERFAALVMLRGAYRPPECGAALGVSVAAILGSADEAYPLPGGTGPEFATLIDAAALRDGALYEVPAPEQAAAAWSLTAKCEDKSQREIGESRVAVLAGCQGKGQVWIAVLSGESHAWSASAGEIVKGFFVNRQRTS